MLSSLKLAAKATRFSSDHWDWEQVLLNLLCLTNVRVGALTRGVPTDFVQVRPLDQNVTKTKGHEDEIGKTIENSIQSLAKERIGAVKLFHQALGHAIDLASEH